MKYAFIDAEKALWPVDVQCDALGVSRSGYYAWKGRPAAPRAEQDEELVDEIKAAYEAGRGTYGSPRVHRELRAKGRRIGKKRVERLMRQHGIAARRKRRFRRTTDSNHSHPIAPNVLDRNFEVELPDTPGQLVKVATLLAEQRANVIQLDHDQFKASGHYTNAVSLGVTVETNGPEHIDRILAALREAGFQPKRIY